MNLKTCMAVMFTGLLGLPLNGQAAVIGIADFDSDALGSVPSAPVSATQGDVTVRTNSEFSTSVAPASGFGDQFAYLTTRNISTVGNSGMDFTGDGNNEWDITYMDIAFNAPAAGQLTFFWNVMTQEIGLGASDLIQIVLDDNIVFKKATDYDNGSYPRITSWFPCGTNGCTDPYGELFSYITPFSYTTAIAAGAHTMRFLVADETDWRYPTALVVGDITLTTASVPEPAELALLGIGLAGIGGTVRARKKSRSLSGCR